MNASFMRNMGVASIVAGFVMLLLAYFWEKFK